MKSKIVTSCFLLFTLLIGGCAGTAKNIQDSADRSSLKGTVNESYEEVATKKMWSLEGMVKDQRVYGRKIGEEKLSNGMVVYKHVNKTQQTSGPQFLGVITAGDAVSIYRLFYFVVDDQGNVADWGHGSYQSTQSCFALTMTESFDSDATLSAELYKKCGEEKLSGAFMEMDERVTMSNGQPYLKWHPGA